MQFHEVANIFPMMSASEYDALKTDIQANGLLEPIWLHEGKIIDGRNRYQACIEIGVKPSFREWSGNGSLVAFVVSLNLHRRHLNESQRGMIAAKLANMKIGGDRPSQTDRNFDSANLQNRNEISRAEAAEMLNVSERTVNDAAKVKNSAVPELVELCESGVVAVSAAVQVVDMEPEVQRDIAQKVASGEVKSFKEATRLVRAKTVSERHIEQPSGKYRVIYADPPWSYGNTQPDYHPEQRDHYPVMSLREICELPVEEMAEDDAVLFLWVTSPILEEAFDVIKAWGFEYKSSFVWDKVKHNMGHYNSVRHEFILVCTRGSCQPDVRKLFDSVITEERTAHSVKPSVVYEIIDTIYPYGKRVELFARRERENWDVWGLEAPVALRA